LLGFRTFDISDTSVNLSLGAPQYHIFNLDSCDISITFRRTERRKFVARNIAFIHPDRTQQNGPRPPTE